MAKSDYEEAIIKLLRKQRRPLSTLKIARKTDITWPTTKKYLGELRRAGRVTRTSLGRKTYWKPVKVSGYKAEGKRPTRTYSRRKPRKRTLEF